MVSVLWKDMDADQELYAFAPDREMVSASTIKVLILLAALERVRQGRETLDGLVEVPASLILEDTTVYEYGSTTDTLDHLLRWMIILSDNTATNVLIHRLGMEEINAYGRSIGLRLSRVERVMLDFAAIEQGRNNYTSAREQCRMYELLLRRSILTPALCNYAMEVLLSQRQHLGLPALHPLSLEAGPQDRRAGLSQPRCGPLLPRERLLLPGRLRAGGPGRPVLQAPDRAHIQGRVCVLQGRRP